MAITIKFDSINELNGFIASAIAGSNINVVNDSAVGFPVPTPPQDSQGVDMPDARTGFRITSDNVDYHLDAGDNVHWSGAKFTFDGVVETVTRDIGDDDKVVFIRRNDTSKLVSLTNSDIDTHTLLKLAA